MNDSLVSRLRDLKLSGIIKTLDVRNEEALKNNLSYMEFFELLINYEVLNRQNNSNIKRTSKARFPQHKTREEYNFNYHPNINKRFIYNLATCEFVRKNENVAFIGPPGTGKTHLAISIGLKAVAQGYKVLFTTVNEMLEELYILRADNSFHQKLRYYTTPDLLILDELGLKKLNQNSVDDFYEIISRRYKNGSIIITSNKVFEEWARIFYDPVLATAILDRFVHHCHFVVIKGESYTMKQREGVIKAMTAESLPKEN
ncbi:IS21-like element helper ATPase IstB [Caloramator sp. mosi_1]|uniref:IS21-like element helper ATPase IstB n=1 Tax=Caloramator sp. mosi_1 TaxID=3023090 RepID=UPI002361E427|nr:IS21-like element helper ATPase IstB [Caloramator sp. mosi_1]WDC83379.1 IS21-like element helper ATPase IstB [Caloramator sp. mosi_1]